MLEEQDRIFIPDSCLQQPFYIIRSRRHDNLQSWLIGKYGFN
ncbi:Uncharacterised protein [Mycobacteroides abscessus subsp. abscessus]|nr:Uncharacterised protein [Mycobacteroides abscessus subsp. abscessus]